MNLVEQIKTDMIEAMKGQEKERLMVLRMVKATMQQEQIDRKREWNDDLVIDVVNKQIKMRLDSILEFERGNRPDLVEQTRREIAFLEKYLPEQLSEEEIEVILDAAFHKIQPTQPKDMGKIMQEVTPQLKGKADMRMISERIKNRLNPQ